MLTDTFDGIENKSFSCFYRFLYSTVYYCKISLICLYICIVIIFIVLYYFRTDCIPKQLYVPIVFVICLVFINLFSLITKFCYLSYRVLFVYTISVIFYLSKYEAVYLDNK